MSPTPDIDTPPFPAMGTRACRKLTSTYALAHFGKSLFWNSGELIFAYFLTEVAGLSGWAMAVVMGSGLVVNAFLDMIIGHRLAISDLSLAAAGRAQQVGAVAAAIALLMLFATSFVPESVQFIYALVTMLAFRGAYALYDVPQNAMLSLGTADAAGRRRVSALRLFFSGMAAIVVAATTTTLIFVNAYNSRLAFAACAGVFAAVAIATALALGSRTQAFSGISGTVPDAAPPRDTRRRVLAVPALLLAMLPISIATATFTKLEPYYVAATAEQGFGAGMLMIAASLGSALSQPFWLIYGQNEERAAIYAPLFLLIVSLALFGLLAPLGVYALLGGAFLFGVSSGGVGQMIWSAYADSVSARGGEETWAYGLFTGIAKLGIALSAVIAGGVLTIADHQDGNLAPLLVAMVLIPILCVTAASIILMRAEVISPLGRQTG